MKLIYGEIILYGTTWCFDTRQSRRFLDNNQIPYRYIDINNDQEARAFVEKVNHGCRSVPTIVFPDQCILVEPSDAELDEKCRLFLIIDA
jgi:glutaredoxin